MEAQRIMVYGVTGSGKSTLAARLGEITGLPAIAIDDLTWRLDWEPVPKDEQRAIIAEVCGGRGGSSITGTATGWTSCWTGPT